MFAQVGENAVENQAAIFTEFYQVGNPAREQDKGLGLGLSIVDRLARALDISGTPAFIIGDRIIPGVIDGDTMKKLIEQSRKPTDVLKKG